MYLSFQRNPHIWKDLKIALLIDGDNISASYITSILDEPDGSRVTTIKRI